MAIKNDNASVKTYNQLQDELQEVTSSLESGELSIDKALASYESGLKLVAELEKVLKLAENRIIELKAAYKVSG
jgi:exodeoxyribonuclease VII small subunit